MLTVLSNREKSAQRPHCMAGAGGFELTTAACRGSGNIGLDLPNCWSCAAPKTQPAGAKRNARRIDARQRLSTFLRVGLRLRSRAFSPARGFLWKVTG